MKEKLAVLFKFPRHDLEDRWWHRLFKVAAIISVAAYFIFSVRLANDLFQPYYTFSFEKDFASQPGKAKDIGDIKIALDDYVFLTMAYKYSEIPGAYEYVTELEKDNPVSFIVADKMQREGKLDNVLVKDLQYNFKEKYYKICFVIVTVTFFYLFLVNFVYRTIAYIFAGKKAV